MIAPPAETKVSRYQFSSSRGWLNDPNGLVYLDGEYHLFYQHNPGQRIWGPMHWGHAVSTDLINWIELPVALEPDELGDIFSGSIVADKEDRFGFSKNGETVLVAFFTHHDADAKKRQRSDFERQSMAYSNDKGRTWSKYAKNPILENPGDARDFRDPCVFWHDASESWIMLLAAGDRMKIYRSSSGFSWEWASDFTAGLPHSAGIWECPHLCKIPIEGTYETKWVLLVSFNPGGLYGGSGTRYFVGRFDGHVFTVDDEYSNLLARHGSQWVDWGPDNYAGITWANLPASQSRPLLISWMNNWAYCQSTLEKPFRGRMTMPRRLVLKASIIGLVLKSCPAIDFNQLEMSSNASRHPSELDRYSFSVTVAKGTPIEVGFLSSDRAVVDLMFDAGSKKVKVDRHIVHPAGNSNEVASRFEFDRLSNSSELSLDAYVSASGIEIFLDGGLQTISFLTNPDFRIDDVVVFGEAAKTSTWPRAGRDQKFN